MGMFTEMEAEQRSVGAGAEGKAEPCLQGTERSSGASENFRNSGEGSTTLFARNATELYT